MEAIVAKRGFCTPGHVRLGHGVYRSQFCLAEMRREPGNGGGHAESFPRIVWRMGPPEATVASGGRGRGLDAG